MGAETLTEQGQVASPGTVEFSGVAARFGVAQRPGLRLTLRGTTHA